MCGRKECWITPAKDVLRAPSDAVTEVRGVVLHPFQIRVRWSTAYGTATNLFPLTTLLGS
jgi:hypothetical protein